MNFAALSAMQGGQDPLIQLLRGVMGGQGGMQGGMPQNALARLMPMMGMKGMMGGSQYRPAVEPRGGMFPGEGGGQYHTLPYDTGDQEMIGGMLGPGAGGLPPWMGGGGMIDPGFNIGFPGGGGLFPGQQLPPWMMLPQPIGAPGTAPNEGGMDRYGGAFKDEFWNPGFRGGFRGRPGSIVDVVRGMQGGPAGIFRGMDAFLSRFGRDFKSGMLPGEGMMKSQPMPGGGMLGGPAFPMPQRGVGAVAPNLPMPAMMERDTRFGKGDL